MKYVIPAGVALAALFSGLQSVPATENVAHATIQSTARPHPQYPGCAKTFTVQMAMRAADAVDHGTRRVTLHNKKMLHRIMRCQRNLNARAFVRGYYRRAARAHALRVYLREHPPQVRDLASWYSDGGATASGFHAYYGVANRHLTFGTSVRICYPYRSTHCVTATVDDRGPYSGARKWDLNQNVAGALGFEGVHDVGVHIY